MSPPLSRPGLLAALAGAAAVALGVALAVGPWRSRSPQPPTGPAPSAPPLPDSPYRNTRPGVGYVGDRACADCHAGVAETFHHHPMGRDLSPVSQLAERERLDATAHNPFEKFGLHFAVERRGDREIHRVTGPDVPAGATPVRHEDEVQLAIGSGGRGRSYVVDHDGFLVQSAVSWFAEAGVWDLSPGFGRSLAAGLPVQPNCLFCHCNTAEPVEGTVSRYRHVENIATIGCERCHGPGQLHVARWEGGAAPAGPDDTIVNPGRLEPALREAVCQQCHLTTKYRVLRRGRGPFDYRPGLPLHEFWSVFVHAPELAEDRRHASRPEQMAASRCFQASGGKLGCVSCHDPHATPEPAARVAFYRDRCLRCHQETSCGLPVADRRQRDAQDSCAACHMPRQGSRKSAHVTDTDHRILRRPEPMAPPRAPRPLDPGATLLVSFHAGLAGPGPGEVERDLGLALAEVANDTPELRRHAGRQALALLQEAVRRWPDDAPAWQAKAQALRLLGRPREAADDLRAALAASPERESALEAAAALASELGEWAAARELWQRAAAVNPWNAGYRMRLGEALVAGREWDAAERASREALRLDPTSTDARTVLVSSLLGAGRWDQARAEFEALLALRPPNAEELRRWFTRQGR